jgi:hypothetical protein
MRTVEEAGRSSPSLIPPKHRTAIRTTRKSETGRATRDHSNLFSKARQTTGASQTMRNVIAQMPVTELICVISGESNWVTASAKVVPK